MNLIRMLEGAQGGHFYATVAASIGADAEATRAAMESLCPSIAQELQTRAAEDDGLMQALMEVLEDGSQGPPLEDAGALTHAEAIKDGEAILEDVYGSLAAAESALRAAAPDISGAAFPKLAAISATAVVAALVQAQMPMMLTGAQPAMSGGGILGTIVDALVKGVMQEATRQLKRRTTSRWRSSRTSSRKRKTAATKRATARKSTTRKTTTRKASARKKAPGRRSSSISIEDIFRDIFGSNRNS